MRGSVAIRRPPSSIRRRGKCIKKAQKRFQHRKSDLGTATVVGEKIVSSSDDTLFHLGKFLIEYAFDFDSKDITVEPRFTGLRFTGPRFTGPRFTVK